MLTREQVLYVAKLARLDLSEDEIVLFTSELSKVLDYIDKIEEIDLTDVEPTSSVIALENVLRPDEPQPSIDRDIALSNAPDPAMGGFRVPSPGPAE
jgi:aspartyl-tRNA(Asn)/glutamyl-tRNA(Gln) amidotransferase subunit C